MKVHLSEGSAPKRRTRPVIIEERAPGFQPRERVAGLALALAHSRTVHQRVTELPEVPGATRFTNVITLARPRNPARGFRLVTPGETLVTHTLTWGARFVRARAPLAVRVAPVGGAALAPAAALVRL